MALRHSQVTSCKAAGYFRLPDARKIEVDSACYEIRTARGSGPGGQGVNSSSNKIELRLDLELLGLSFDECIIENIRRNERLDEKNSDKNSHAVMLSSHEHRSALQNREECLARVREMIRQASWVPPVEADPIKTPGRTITQKKNDRWKKSNMNRARRSARQGSW